MAAAETGPGGYYRMGRFYLRASANGWIQTDKDSVLELKECR